MKQEQIRKDDENRNGGGVSNPTSIKKSKFAWTYNSNLIWVSLTLIVVIGLAAWYISNN